MKSAHYRLVVAAIVVLGFGGYGLYRLGVNEGSRTQVAPAPAPAVPSQSQAQGAALFDPASGKRVLYWHDPMVPGQRFDHPGKSPYMDMDLVPVYADETVEAQGVAIDPRVLQNLGVRTAVVSRGRLHATIEAVGSVAYNERDVAVVAARANGFVEKLYVRAPLDPVSRGQKLAELYVPEWIAVQEDYASARRIAARAGTSHFDGLLEAARQRMRLAGMDDEQIRAVESSGSVQPRVIVTAPIGGVIAELGVREGMTVMAGAPMFRINGLGTIWVNAEVPETVAARVRPGNAVEARTAAFPGETFAGKVGAILPEVNPATRTQRVRIELANPRGRLAPGMFVSLNFGPSATRAALLVPSEAVIRTGKRNVVIVARGEGKFAAVEVAVGQESDNQTEIRSGLEENQKVVVSGQFLIDSEASLKASVARMTQAEGPAQPSDVAASVAGRIDAPAGAAPPERKP